MKGRGEVEQMEMNETKKQHLEKGRKRGATLRPGSSVSGGKGEMEWKHQELRTKKDRQQQGRRASLGFGNLW